MCIRSLGKDYEECGVLLHGAVQGKGFVGDGSGEVGPDSWEGLEGIRVIFIAGNQ